MQNDLQNRMRIACVSRMRYARFHACDTHTIRMHNVCRERRVVPVSSTCIKYTHTSPGLFLWLVDRLCHLLFLASRTLNTFRVKSCSLTGNKLCKVQEAAIWSDPSLILADDRSNVWHKISKLSCHTWNVHCIVQCWNWSYRFETFSRFFWDNPCSLIIYRFTAVFITRIPNRSQTFEHRIYVSKHDTSWRHMIPSNIDVMLNIRLFRVFTVIHVRGFFNVRWFPWIHAPEGYNMRTKLSSAINDMDHSGSCCWTKTWF